MRATFLAFPVACFSLTVLTDLAYVQTLNLLWLHFSEWLLFAGLIFGTLAALVVLVDAATRRVRTPWPGVLAGLVVLLLATLNSFIHTADGWTAVMPYGLAVSVLTVLAMIVTAWLARPGLRHVPGVRHV
ncbi:DUF2231 domain-containing protein [Ancylobacter terrae]|uniref:DUF2231 domain-containing protein n=1 Tax=Ancylobacter sp. sgz301288 TaxID=3342077 RepID=UPI00385B2A4A